MDNPTIVLYATIKTIHDKKKNILDSYIPFIEHCLYQHKESLSVSLLQNFIIDNYKIEIPKNTLTTILNSLKKKNLISIKGEDIIIQRDMKSQNEEYIKYYEKSKRDLNEFIIFYKNNYSSQEIQDEEVLKLINDFVLYSIKYFNLLQDIPANAVFNPVFHELVQYIIDIRNNNDHLFTIFKNIFFGGLLLNLINTHRENTQLQNSLAVYLDTSYLFRILELQNPFFNSAAKELFEIMKKHKFKFFIFEQNYNELRSKLIYIRKKMLENKYEQNYYDDFNNIDGLEGSILRNFKSFALLDEFIDELNEKLKKLGIEVVSSSILETVGEFESLENALTRVKIYKDYYCKILAKNKDLIKDDLLFESDFLEYKNPNELVDDIKKRIIEKCIDEKAIDIPDFKTFYESITDTIKENYGFHSALSVKVIKYIKEKRMKNFTNFSDCKLFYLTSDNTLFKFNNKNHIYNKTIPEVMLDRLVTNILWSYNPTITGDVPIKQVLAAFQASNFLEYDYLNKFYDFVKHYIDLQPSEENILDNVFSNLVLPYELNKIKYENPNSGDEDVFNQYIKKISKVTKEKNEKSERIIKNANKLALRFSGFISWVIFSVFLAALVIQLIFSIIPNLEKNSFNLGFWLNFISGFFLLLYEITFGLNIFKLRINIQKALKKWIDHYLQN
ncbi:MAG: hypothetical protein HPY53_05125 [Brevinematales bacterium]|nr:hypothetical protein [Brevinematales bacterium]